MGAIRRSRTAVAILVLFLVVGLAYMALAEVLGYRIEWAGVTMLAVTAWSCRKMVGMPV